MTGAPREAYAPRDFIIVSMAAVRLLDGSWESAGCFQRIAWRAERDGYWRATMKEIAAEIGVSERTAKRITTRLREIGWLTAERENTWDATLTWRVVFEGDVPTGDGPPDGGEPAGQDREGHADPTESDTVASSGGPNRTSESASVASSGSTPLSLTESATVAPSQSATVALTSTETDETDENDDLRSSTRATGRRSGVSGSHPAPEGSQRDGVTASRPGEQAALVDVEPKDPVLKFKTKRRLPEDFRVTKRMRAWFVDQGFTGFDAIAETEAFKDHHIARGTTMLDWERAWQEWMRRAQQYAIRDNARGGGRGGNVRPLGNVHHSEDPEHRRQMLEGWN